MSETSNNIAQARKDYESRSGVAFTQKDAAAEFGVSLGTYRNYEQQKSVPNGITALAIAKKYGVSIDYLLNMSKVNYAIVSIDQESSDETELLEMYRQLPPKMRRALIAGLKEYTS